VTLVQIVPSVVGGEVGQVRSRVVLFEKIRRDRRREELSIRDLAERHGVHRRTVRQASAVPPPRKTYPLRRRPAIEPFGAVIDGWLIEDRTLRGSSDTQPGGGSGSGWSLSTARRCRR
jgi:hypothetical protein